MAAVTLPNPTTQSLDSFADIFNVLWENMNSAGVINIVLLVCSVIAGVSTSLAQTTSFFNFTDDKYYGLVFSAAGWSEKKLYIKTSIPLVSVPAITEILIGALRVVMSMWGLFFNVSFVSSIFGDVVNSSFVPWEWIFYIFSPAIFGFGIFMGLYRMMNGILAYNNFFQLS